LTVTLNGLDGFAGKRFVATKVNQLAQ